MSHPNGCSSSAKTIYLIRHGVARHNVRGPHGEKPDLLDPSYTDPELIRQGEIQASVLGEQLRRKGLTIDENSMNMEDNDDTIKPIELVVCSPLTRCLQTASHIFPSHFASNNSSNQSNEPSPIILDRNCKVCCHKDVREEAYGVHYPDRRSPLSQVKSKFPTVTYHPSITEHDIDWQPNVRETSHDVVQRIHSFFTWLSLQPHDNIAIVTHGVWIECTLLHYCPEVLDNGNKRVYNCDVYCGRLSTKLSTPTLSNVEQMTFYHA